MRLSNDASYDHIIIFKGDVMRALGQNPTESEVKKLVNEHRADDRVTFETFLPIMQVNNFIIVASIKDRRGGWN